MHQPVIAAVDPLRDDIAPVALGLMLARLTSASLLLAGAYPDLHLDGVSPGLTRAFGAEADQRMSRFGALVEHAPGPRVAVATTVVADERAATVLRRGLDAVSAGRSAGGEILTGHPDEHALAD